ncbi:hypothetical protein [Endozoicomonas sp. 4G]|uniref:hypothetical protein n=1 Tax=Endozoicomonas sp. 4G TaxID=2872754 RepID=UPI002078AAC8|nr:hypothetical protein [Endozoicomonas sp. 4G]
MQKPNPSTLQHYHQLNDVTVDNWEEMIFEGSVYRIIDQKTGLFSIGYTIHSLKKTLRERIVNAKRRENNFRGQSALINNALSAGRQSALKIEQLESLPFHWADKKQAQSGLAALAFSHRETDREHCVDERVLTSHSQRIPDRTPDVEDKFCHRCQMQTERRRKGHCKRCHQKVSKVQNYKRIDGSSEPLVDCLDTAEFEASIFKLTDESTGRYYLGVTLQRLSSQLRTIIYAAKSRDSRAPATLMIKAALDADSDLTITPVETRTFTLATKDKVRTELKTRMTTIIPTDDPLCMN